MESYSYNSASYPDSGHSSPRSRDIDFENPPPWEDHSSPNSKVKFMCSYGGKIHPRPHDNQLSYIGGETKILSVDRTTKFSSLISKLSALSGDSDLSFKYQLPGEDLDALISVTNDDDLEHMMHEYDRQSRGSAKPARMRLFLFPAAPSPPPSFGSDGGKSDSFVEALIPKTVAAAVGQRNDADFLFGGIGGPPVVKVPDFPAANLGSGVREDRVIGSDPVAVQAAQLQRLQIREQKAPPPPQMAVIPPPVMPPPRTEAIIPQGNWPEKHVVGGGGGLGYDGVQVPYEDPMRDFRQMRAPPNSADPASYGILPPEQQQQSLYMQPAFNGQAGQGYYVQQRMGGVGPADIYREQQQQPVYNMVPTMSQPQPPPPAAGGVQQMTMVSSGVTVTADAGGARYQLPTGTMAYDSTIGRQVYYPAQGGMVHHQQQAVGPGFQGMVFNGGEMRRAAGVGTTSEAAAKMVNKVPQ